MRPHAPSASPRPARRRAPRPSPADLADRLHSAAIHLLRRLRREDDASGLPAPQLSALSVIVFLVTFGLALVYIRFLGAELIGARR